MIGKVQPQAIELEKVVLGGIIIDSGAMAKVTHLLTKESFYIEKHQIIFNACLELNNKRNPIDLVSINEQLKTTDKLNEIGGIRYLLELSNMVASTANIEYHAFIIADKYMKRQIVQVSSNLVHGAFDDNNSKLIEIAKDASKLIDKYISKDQEKEDSLKDVYDNLINDIGTKPLVGLSTGFKHIDDATNGILAPDLTTLAAGPGEGKSLLALNIANEISKTKYVPFFSLEMNRKQIVERLVSSYTGYSITELRKGEYFDKNTQRFEKIDKALILAKSLEIKSLNLNIIDKNIKSVEYIVSRVRIDHENKKDIGLVVIDYLQLIPTSDAKNKNRDQLLGEISRALKSLTLDLNIPILLLSQVSRDKTRSRYQKADLRESGNIEQDSDNVWFIFRPIEHHKDTFNFNGEKIFVEKYDAFLQIEKNRSGATQDIRLIFDGKGSKFKDFIEPEPFTIETNSNSPF